MVKTMENDNQAKGVKPRCYTSLAQMRQGELTLSERLSEVLDELREAIPLAPAAEALRRLNGIKVYMVHGGQMGGIGINGINRDSFVGGGQSGPSFNLGYKD
jgi:hypothetical protein